MCNKNKIINEEINSVTDLLNFIQKFKNGRGDHLKHPHLQLWFRGQASDAYKLQPGLYREDFHKTIKDEDALKKERHMTQDFQVESCSILGSNKSIAELYFLQQHYGMPTRLLDWSNSPLAALFFAVKSLPKANANIFLMDAYQLRGYEGISTRSHPNLSNALAPIYDWRKEIKDFPKNIIAIRPDHVDHRVSLQRSCFTFHVPERKELTLNDNKTLVSYKIPSKSKKLILEELSTLGIDHFSIYGDLEGLAKRLKSAYS
jgi:FRG domain